MNDVIKNIIREEFEGVMSKKYSEDEVNDAIHNKHFIHTKNGKVYSPVVLKRGFFVGVSNDNEHQDIPLEEITLIQSQEDRFKKK
jgi:hypothetical protein